MATLIYATVLRGQRGQNQEQQSVRGGVQSKVEKAVDQHSETPSQSSRRHAPPELVVRFAPRESLAKEHYQKTQSQKAPYDASVGKRLQIIVVSLLQAIVSVPRVV